MRQLRAIQTSVDQLPTLIAITAYGPLFMTALHGTSPLIAGYIIACESIAWTVAAVVVSGAPERNDPKYISAGMLVVTAGFAHAVEPGETAHAARMLFLACLLPAIVGLIAMTRFVAADARHGRG